MTRLNSGQTNIPSQNTLSISHLLARKLVPLAVLGANTVNMNELGQVFFFLQRVRLGGCKTEDGLSALGTLN